MKDHHNSMMKFLHVINGNYKLVNIGDDSYQRSCCRASLLGRTKQGRIVNYEDNFDIIFSSENLGIQLITR